MTERIGPLLTELADVDAPPIPAADPIWRRAGRTRMRRRAAALATVAVALGAAALALTTLSSQPIIGPAGPPADGGAGGLEPLPPRLAAPYGKVPTLVDRPTDRVQLVVESDRFERFFFIPRARRSCQPQGACSTVMLGVGSDHGYRYLVDPRRGGTQFLLAPDGEHAAMLEPVGANGVRRWRFLDLVTSRAMPAVECAGTAGWTRDGWFVCIPASGGPLKRYGIDSSGGVDSIEIGRPSASADANAEITLELLGPDATSLLGAAAEPVAGTAAVRITSVAPGPTQTIFYPDATSVTPIGWCGADTVLVEADGYPAVFDLDGGVLSTGKVGWQAIGCRPDGSMLLRDPSAFRLWLARPDGTSAGEVLLPRGKSGGKGPSAVVAIAIDAFAWQVGGSPAHVPGFRPLEWVDEAALVLVVIGGIGLLVVRQRRKRRMAAAAAELT